MTPGGLPTPDFDAILADDTRLSWLQREDLSHYWRLHSVTAEPIGTANEGDSESAGYYFLRVSESQFQAYKAARFAPPVWPGIDNVTLGTQVAIEAGFTITEPMHGVIVAISAVAPKQMFYTYDDIRAYRHIGALAFLDDVGDAEGWQSLGFVSAVYCCRSMSRAAAVKIMSASGTVGTVTPWLRSS